MFLYSAQTWHKFFNYMQHKKNFTHSEKRDKKMVLRLPEVIFVYSSVHR